MKKKIINFVFNARLSQQLTKFKDYYGNNNGLQRVLKQDRSFKITAISKNNDEDKYNDQGNNKSEQDSQYPPQITPEGVGS